MGGFASAQASGEGSDRLDGCGGLRDVIVLPDGGYLAAGMVKDCVTRIGTPTDGPIAIVRLKSDGSLDFAFADDGVRVLAEGLEHSYRMELLGSGDKFVLATDKVLTRFLADGSIDSSFGGDGSVDLPTDGFAHFDPPAVGIQPDGKIVVGGSAPTGADDQRPSFLRYDLDGEIDPGFGGGVVTLDVPAEQVAVGYIDRIAFDDQGRILAAGQYGTHGNRRFILIRMEADGDPDPSFGPSGNGFAPLPSQAPSTIARARAISIGLKVPDQIQLSYSKVTIGPKDYPYETFTTSADGDGNPDVAGAAQLGPGKFLDFEQLPGGDIATGGYLDTFYPGATGPVDPTEMRMGRLSPLGQGAFAGGRKVVDVKPTPYGGALSSIAYDPASDSLIAAGAIGTSNCFEDCGYQGSSMAVTKFDAETGALDSGFGIGGVVMMPRNVCAGRVAEPAPGTGPTPWNRCVLSKPTLRADAAFAGGASSRPGINLSVRIGDPPRLPALLERKLQIRLPARLTPKGRNVRIQVKAFTGGSAEARPSNEVEASVKGRAITVRYLPETIYDPETDSAGNPPNSDVTFKIRVKRGSLKPIPVKSRHAKLRFRVVGTNVGGRWYGDRSALKVAVARSRPAPR